LILPIIHEASSPDYNAIRNQYLAQIPPGPTVDGGKAMDIKNFFGT
jgi:hypothetical protein